MRQFKADVNARIAILKRYQLHPPELLQDRIQWEKKFQGGPAVAIAEALAVPVGARTDEQWKQINKEFGKTTQLMNRHVSTINREIKVLEKDSAGGAGLRDGDEGKGTAKNLRPHPGRVRSS